MNAMTNRQRHSASPLLVSIGIAMIWYAIAITMWVLLR